MSIYQWFSVFSLLCVKYPQTLKHTHTLISFLFASSYTHGWLFSIWSSFFKLETSVNPITFMLLNIFITALVYFPIFFGLLIYLLQRYLNWFYFWHIYFDEFLLFNVECCLSSIIMIHNVPCMGVLFLSINIDLMLWLLYQYRTQW